ncbi:MAG: DUF4129 domain-containing protein [Luteimonas sp.]|nr:DUF4129 domain-containing protein [Luteimonas sp.]
MRLESVRVELRPRSQWEAVELGMALVRRHAALIWRPWMLVTLPLFAIFNATAWALDMLWLATVAMWWLLPLFDRIPMFVLSRAVFGDPPAARQTLAAQRNWGWRAMRGMLTWRRFSPWRAATLPVDLLEGLQGPALRTRRGVIGNGIQGHAVLVTIACQLFVASLAISLVMLALMFVPTELLSESLRAMWSLLFEQPPRGVQLALNGVLWLAMSAVEPFFVGAGFGLYLNRRVHIEAWDIEIALRRMRSRVATVSAVLLVACSLSLLPAQPASAQTMQRMQEDRERAATAPKAPVEDAAERSRRPTLPEVFGEEAVVDHAPFAESVERAYADPLLDRKTVERVWEKRKPDEPPQPGDYPGFLLALAKLFALVGEFGLWLVFGSLALLLALTAKLWWPWMRGIARGPLPESEIVQAAVVSPEALPDDLADAVRTLWRAGRRRRALALLYRGSVEAMALRAGIALVPGATEAECLRASRRMPEAEDRAAFAGMVRTWQYAAYAERMPGDGEFESLVDDLAQRFGWSR